MASLQESVRDRSVFWLVSQVSFVCPKKDEASPAPRSGIAPKMLWPRCLCAAGTGTRVCSVWLDTQNRHFLRCSGILRNGL